MGPFFEIWKDVEFDTYKGIYQISNYGRVVSKARWIFRSNGTKQWNPDKIMKICSDKKGYCYVNLFKAPGKMNSVSIHRMVAFAFIENPDNKPEVNHKHGDKSGNVFFDLEWSTSKENKKHAWDNGLYSHEKAREASYIRWRKIKAA